MLKTNSAFSLAPAKLLGDMPVGSIIKDVRTSYASNPILWKIADLSHPGYPEGSVTLGSYRLLTCKAVDAKEINNPESKSATKGCSRYIWSNLRRWANSGAPAGEWYAPQHPYDTPPTSDFLEGSNNPYMGEAGFLNGFSAKFLNALMPTTLKAIIPDYYGGGLDEFTDRIFLPSMTEVGLANYKKIDEGAKLAIFSNYDSRVAYPTQHCVASSTWNNGSLNTGTGFCWWTRTTFGTDAGTTYCVDEEGYDYPVPAFQARWGFRPFCNLHAKTRVSSEADGDGAHILFV